MKAGLSHLMKLSLSLALLLTACAPSQTERARNQGPATPPRQVGTVTYGFELRALGVPEEGVHHPANSRKGPWRMAGSPLNKVLTNACWRTHGLISKTETYERLRQA
ncbi:MAG: hypothetical protein M0Z41_06890 [Peptococcaceae bacterium]|jgi:hypothetical protein|nr:hypothetical protein [Peptococcaceae bacterium]